MIPQISKFIAFHPYSFIYLLIILILLIKFKKELYNKKNLTRITLFFSLIFFLEIFHHFIELIIILVLITSLYLIIKNKTKPLKFNFSIYIILIILLITFALLLQPKECGHKYLVYKSNPFYNSPEYAPKPCNCTGINYWEEGGCYESLLGLDSHCVPGGLGYQKQYCIGILP